MSVKVIIPASGKGKRFGGKISKQFLKIDGKEILAHSIEKFNSMKEVDEIIIAAGRENIECVKKIVTKYKLNKVSVIVMGGKERQDSVYNALKLLTCKDSDIVMIHDAVRPFVSTKLIKEIILQAKKSKNVIPGIKVSDTLKRTDNKNNIKDTISRENVWAVQTPQAFNYKLLMNAFSKAYKNGFYGTDEAALMEKYGYEVKVIQGESGNVKITVKEDMQ
ncbi:hypothetical protein BH10BAC5_BH10BAC5_22130 [soil metagenome]